MFETGERIKCISSGSHPEWLKKGKVYVVCGHNNSGSPLVLGKDGSRIDIAYGTFVKEVSMSKYQELKERIENVKGWDKEADDVLNEIQVNHRIAIRRDAYSNCGEVKVSLCSGWGDTSTAENFSFRNQYEKLNAFKQALLWLLDHSDIKNDEKEEKIKDLEYQRDTFATQVRSLNLKIEELRRNKE